MQGAQVQSLVRELDPACMPQLKRSCMPQLKRSCMSQRRSCVPQLRPNAAKIKQTNKNKKKMCPSSLPWFIFFIDHLLLKLPNLFVYTFMVCLSLDWKLHESRDFVLSPASRIHLEFIIVNLIWCKDNFIFFQKDSWLSQYQDLLF